MKHIYHIDVAWDAPIQKVLGAIERSGMRLDDHLSDGPAGGNPMLTLSGTHDQLVDLQSEIARAEIGVMAIVTGD